ncbi:peptide deformylase, mitochondrial isoform X1 [Chelmon rostratus]|uniref:peptide deformylase, mitochondrial isoform X1 n=1 Tax=Chelmon rostratus TaxID=109905 RepID=UPI001BE5CBE8|nr:peptide deformylase, mitochondrial isoform X1 [Chelmon rostratus]XP_041794837.1 peptide deformylase, mitochondrial isoform X1 [Chelmon rostratus]XP_041794838.1 peptide deformylase, mitochondrial isoform X1 [Chelmon rostratus]
MNAKPCVSLLQLSRMGFRLCASKAPRCSAGALNLTSPYLPHISLHSPVPCSHPYSTNVKVRSYLQYMKHMILSRPSPPYCHVCQVGDPVLRSHASAVDPAAITGPEIQQVINTMVKVMRKVDSVGLSAPQIGVPLRILVLEYTERMLEESSPESRKARGLSVQPLRVFVNPQLRILDGQTVLFQEACESITGFSARVPRFLSVEVSGLNEKGEAVSWQASGWPARILQHEMDHLDGVLYIDRMDSKTFININWQAYNE